MEEEKRLEREAMERRLRKDLITKTFPKSREDFDQLYAMVIPTFFAFTGIQYCFILRTNKIIIALQNLCR